MSENLIERAQLLIEQQKYDSAEKILLELLTVSPDNVYVLALLTEIKIQTNNTTEAKQLIDQAIGMDPSFGYLFYLQARVLIQSDDYNASEEALKTAVRLEPDNPDFIAFWANIKNIRKKYKEALKFSEQALELDPENILALNVRSTALLKLNHKDEAAKTIEGALREDPNNAFTHANYGWSELEKGEPKKALEHFAEALRNDPNLEFAQSGMVQALKARYFVYRIFLKYAFWISNMGAKYQWGVIIGFFILFRLLRTTANNMPALEPFLLPILIIMAIVAFSTWVLSPISNLFLRLNRFGSHLLDSKEKLSSSLVGISALLFVTGLILYFITNNINFILVAAFGFTMMVPLGVMFSSSKNSFVLQIYTLILACVGAVAIFNAFYIEEPFSIFTTIYIFGFFAFQWIANYFVIKQDNR